MKLLLELFKCQSCLLEFKSEISSSVFKMWFYVLGTFSPSTLKHFYITLNHFTDNFLLLLLTSSFFLLKISRDKTPPKQHLYRASLCDWVLWGKKFLASLRLMAFYFSVLPRLHLPGLGFKELIYLVYQNLINAG